MDPVAAKKKCFSKLAEKTDSGVKIKPETETMNNAPSTDLNKKGMEDEMKCSGGDRPLQKLQKLLFGGEPLIRNTEVNSETRKGNNSLEERTDSSEPRGSLKTSRKILKSVKSSRGDLNWQVDDCLPLGWTFALVHSSQFDIPLKKLKSPEGQFFNSVVQAIQYLHRVAGREVEFENMKKFLAKEGWFTTNFLPKGFWLRQKRSEKSFYSLSASLEQFRTMRPLFVHLRKTYGAEAEKLFEDNYRSLQVEPDNPKVKRLQNLEDLAEKKNVHDDAEPFDTKGRMLNHEETSEDEGSEDECGELEWEADEDLPAGWQVSVHTLDMDDGGKREVRRYLSPEGKPFGGMAEVVKVLSHDKEDKVLSHDKVKVLSHDIDKEALLSLLPREGWKRVTEFSRHGWWSRSGRRRRSFLTPSLEILSGVVEVLEYVKELDYSQEEMDAFSSLFPEHLIEEEEQIIKTHKMAKKMRLDDVEAKNKDNVTLGPPVWSTHPLLPAGWQQAPSETSGKTMLVQGPTGAIYPTRLAAIRAMQQWGAGLDEVESMRKSFAIDGFEAGEELPKGWMVRDSQTFLTSSLELIERGEEALLFMMEHTYPQMEIDNFRKRWVGEEGWTEDDTLPNGWKIRIGEAGTEVREANGKVVGSRAQAIKFLATRPQAADGGEVAKMRLGLCRDGWMPALRLPTDWLTKKRGDGTSVYLTEKYEMLKSVKNALSYMKMKSYSRDVIERFILGPEKRKAENGEEINTKRKKELISEEVLECENLNRDLKEEPFKENESSSCLPKGWRELAGQLVSPEGKVFASRASAVEWMIKGRREPEEIYAIWSELEKEGWELGAASTSLLPAGWRIKWLPGIQDWHFLSR